MRSVLGTIVLVVAALGASSCSSGVAHVQPTATPATEIVNTTTQVTANPAPSADLACPGSEQLVQILPAGAGESSPEAEIRSFTVAFGQGLSTSGYIAEPVALGNSGEPERLSYVHPAGDERTDVRLTLVKLDDGWHVDSVVTCAG